MCAFMQRRCSAPTSDTLRRGSTRRAAMSPTCTSWGTAPPLSTRGPISSPQSSSANSTPGDPPFFSKMEEKRENFSLRKLRKPGERVREKYFASFFEFPHTKRENFSLRKLRKPGERQKEKVVLLFSSTLFFSVPLFNQTTTILCYCSLLRENIVEVHC
jgi:hypothetical protein